MLVQRFPQLSEKQILAIAGIPREEIRHTRAMQDWLAEAARVVLRLLNRRCAPLNEATTARIQALPLEQLEALAVGAAFSAGVALLDFSSPQDLHNWLQQGVSGC